jgi:hypothetical protein
MSQALGVANAFGIETDRGPWVQALIATGYAVSAINPMQVSRYRGTTRDLWNHGTRRGQRNALNASLQRGKIRRG